MDNIDYGTRAALISAALKRAREEQDTPIPQMRTVGGFAVGPTGGDIFNMGIRQALGGYSANKREEELTALNDEQMGKFADLSQQLATPGSVDYNDPASLVADNSKRMGLASQMAQLNLPQAQKVAQDYLQKGVNLPDTLAQLRLRQIEAGQQNAVRLEEQARRAAEAEAGKNERAAQHNALMMTLKQMGRASGGGGSPQIAFVQTVDEQGNPVTQVVDKRQLAPGTTFGKAPTAAERKAVAEANIGVANIEDALERVKGADPKSFGLQYAIPGAEKAGQYFDKEGIEPRAVVSNIGSMKIHDRSGATVTVSEFPRLAPFVPSTADSKATIEKKLGLLKEEYGRIAKEWGRDPASKPKAAAPAAPAGPVNFSDLK